ncbi:transposase [Latilactobacillus curvatus]|uniref:transposase n=1 Tax=Latilactobacillus curvatus TaxID=28038 RepID=UPI00117B4A28
MYATVVADCFHLFQISKRVLKQISVQLIHRYVIDSFEHKFLKYHWKLLLKHPSDLENTKTQCLPQLRDHLTQEQLIEITLNFNSKFYTPHHSIIDALTFCETSLENVLIND